MLSKIARSIPLLALIIIGASASAARRSDAQVALSPQIYAAVNQYLTGSNSQPSDTSIIVAYSASGNYIVVSWSGQPIGTDMAGQALFVNQGGNWQMLEATGGQLDLWNFQQEGVDAGDAAALEPTTNIIATPTNNFSSQFRSDWPYSPRQAVP